MIPRAFLLCLLCCCLLASSARARAASRGPDGRARSEQRGTHFLLEGHAGASTYHSGGLAMAVVLGGGGKLPGELPRVYLILELSHSSAMHSGTASGLGLPYEDTRGYLDLALGLRIYLPIYRSLRVFGDAQAGGSLISARLERQGLLPRAANGWLALGQLGAGLQMRIFHEISLGLRAKLVLSDEDLGGLRGLVEEDSPRRSIATLSMTWHF